MCDRLLGLLPTLAEPQVQRTRLSDEIGPGLVLESASIFQRSIANVVFKNDFCNSGAHDHESQIFANAIIRTCATVRERIGWKRNAGGKIGLTKRKWSKSTRLFDHVAIRIPSFGIELRWILIDFLTLDRISNEDEDDRKAAYFVQEQFAGNRLSYFREHRCPQSSSLPEVFCVEEQWLLASEGGTFH